MFLLIATGIHKYPIADSINNSRLQSPFGIVISLICVERQFFFKYVNTWRQHDVSYDENRGFKEL